MSAHIAGSSADDLEEYQVGVSFPYLAVNTRVFVQSCFLAVTPCVEGRPNAADTDTDMDVVLVRAVWVVFHRVRL